MNNQSGHNWSASGFVPGVSCAFIITCLFDFINESFNGKECSLDWLIRGLITINQLGILNCFICDVKYQGRHSAVLKSQLLVVLGCNKSSWNHFFSLCFEPHMLLADTKVPSSVPTIPSLAAGWNGSVCIALTADSLSNSIIFCLLKLYVCVYFQGHY